MRMTERDRLMAIARCPEYLKYREALLKSAEESDSEKKIALLGKIRFPWDPIELLYLSLPTGVPGFDEIREGLLKSLEREAVVMVKESEWPRPRGKAEPVPGTIWTLNKGRVFVRLRIDLSRTEGELTEAFAGMIKAWKQQYMLKERTRKKTDYDPWEIYDLFKTGLSKNEIARRKTGKSYPPGKESNPTYNDELSAPDKRVDRAYNQAGKMIQAVGAEVKSWFTKNGPSPLNILK